ncbi:FCD domain-containing protein [uncultured Litoreibacter sp.]|uniref:FCD domain-containing protein n=1 Tax=uncultured Litoreibacter sp. TaxID=1392394 RepID=UPI0026238C64|nr:FCD domain-containing protein [uncultured Litoreibacter sp.]
MILRRDAKEDETVIAMLAASLRRDISFGVLLPDQKLKIQYLRSLYGGSNHSMRETLRILSSEGLVEATSQRGFRVTSATEEDVRDILMVRSEIEKLALGLAVDDGDIAWEGRVIAAHHALRKAEDRVIQDADDLTALEWDEACRGFSHALIDACGSPRLIDLQRKLFNQSRRFRLALLREGRLNFELRRVGQQRIVDAVLARDREAAISALLDDIKSELKSDT